MMPKLPQVLRVPYSSLAYSPSVARYRGTNGRFQSPESIRKVIEADIEATKGRMADLAGKASRGEISVEVWRGRQAREVKSLHLAHLAAAKGGFHALTQSDFGRVGQIVREQYVYLNNRASIAASDPAYLASERFVRDATSYGDAGIVTYEAQRLVEEKAAGFEWEFNVLDDGAHHCAPKGDIESCQQQTDKGVVPAGTLVRFGFCRCKGKCRCSRRRFKTKEAAEKAFAAMGV